ncbi:MAG: ParB N-terminal domain-containing protein [Candidatus Sulfotelmatobacter sp.]
MPKAENPLVDGSATVAPKGLLKDLLPEQVVRSKNNPRRLFDEGPLRDLRDNIRQHGVLVPITVYPVKGQPDKYAILDGERRHRCVLDLKKEGIAVTLPANIVDPPSKVAGLLYMFSIHGFREQWELMPTALSLEIVMRELGETDNHKLVNLTGLSEPQIERCKKLLKFDKEFQDLSLDPDPKTRIPSNFWIEALPLIDLSEKIIPDLYEKLGRNGIIRKLVDKYRAGAIKSVIHFRRVMEAYEFAEGARKRVVVDRIKRYILNTEVETREAFDEFVMENRRVQNAINACQGFIHDLKRFKLRYVADKDDLSDALVKVRTYVDYLIERLKGSDPPPLDESPGEDA